MMNDLCLSGTRSKKKKKKGHNETRETMASAEGINSTCQSEAVKEVEQCVYVCVCA